MPIKHADALTVVERMAVLDPTHAAYTNVTLNDCFDTGGASVVVLQAFVGGSIVGDPTLNVRVDHSVDGLEWAELASFDPWIDETGVKIMTIPSIEGAPAACAQYLRIMVKIDGASTQFQYFEVKASLKG